MENKYQVKFPVSLAFTLFELVVVLAIISALIVIVVPFNKRGNEKLKIQQYSNDIAQTCRYAIDLAGKKQKAVRFIFSEKGMYYCLQIMQSSDYSEPLEIFAGSPRYIDKNIHLFDIEGFEQNGQEYFLAFDPQKPWPVARITFTTDDLTEIIKIDGKYVWIEQTTM